VNLLSLLKHNRLFHLNKLINYKILKISLLLHPFSSFISLSFQLFLFISWVIFLLLSLLFDTIENLLLKFIDWTFGRGLNFGFDSSNFGLAVHVLKGKSVFKLDEQIVSSSSDFDYSGDKSIGIKSFHQKMCLLSLSIVNCKFGQIVESNLK
jgi:hypothetical protein